MSKYPITKYTLQTGELCHPLHQRIFLYTTKCQIFLGPFLTFPFLGNNLGNSHEGVTHLASNASNLPCVISKLIFCKKRIIVPAIGQRA